MSIEKFLDLVRKSREVNFYNLELIDNMFLTTCQLRRYYVKDCIDVGNKSLESKVVLRIDEDEYFVFMNKEMDYITDHSLEFYQDFVYDNEFNKKSDLVDFIISNGGEKLTVKGDENEK